MILYQSACAAGMKYITENGHLMYDGECLQIHFSQGSEVRLISPTSAFEIYPPI